MPYQIKSYQINVEGYIEAMKKMPQKETFLDLSRMVLGCESVANLVKLFRAIPDWVTDIDLRSNLFKRKTPSELVEILDSIPPTVKSIDLTCNFPYGKTQNQKDKLDEIVKALEPFTRNGRLGWLATHYFNKAFFPLVSFINRNKLPEEVACKILSFLIPGLPVERIFEKAVSAIPYKANRYGVFSTTSVVQAEPLEKTPPGCGKCNIL